MCLSTPDHGRGETLTVEDKLEESSESLFGKASSRRRDVEEDLSFVAVDIAYSPTQTRFNVAASYDIPSDGHPMLYASKTTTWM